MPHFEQFLLLSGLCSLGVVCLTPPRRTAFVSEPFLASNSAYVYTHMQNDSSG